MMDALATAGAGAETMPDPTEEPKDKPEGEDDSMPEGSACMHCKMQLDPKDAYCSKCGTPTVPPKDEPKDDESPDSSARGAALAAKMSAARAPLAPVAAADRFGANSVPALRSALATATATLDSVARLVGAKTHGEILGAVEATAKDARNAIRYRSERDKEREAAAERERIDILMALSAKDPNGHPRGKLLVDVVVDGKVTGVKPAELWGDGPKGRTLENLRGYSRTVLEAVADEPNPYDAPAANPSGDAAGANPNEPSVGEIEAAKRDPAVIIAARTTPGAKLDDLARNHVLANRAVRRATVSA